MDTNLYRPYIIQKNKKSKKNFDSDVKHNLNRFEKEKKVYNKLKTELKQKISIQYSEVYEKLLEYWQKILIEIIIYCNNFYPKENPFYKIFKDKILNKTCNQNDDISLKSIINWDKYLNSLRSILTNDVSNILNNKLNNKSNDDDDSKIKALINYGLNITKDFIKTIEQALQLIYICYLLFKEVNLNLVFNKIITNTSNIFDDCIKNKVNLTSIDKEFLSTQNYKCISEPNNELCNINLESDNYIEKSDIEANKIFNLRCNDIKKQKIRRIPKKLSKNSLRFGKSIGIYINGISKKTAIISDFFYLLNNLKNSNNKLDIIYGDIIFISCIIWLFDNYNNSVREILLSLSINYELSDKNNKLLNFLLLKLKPNKNNFYEFDYNKMINYILDSVNDSLKNLDDNLDSNFKTDYNNSMLDLSFIKIMFLTTKNDKYDNIDLKDGTSLDLTLDPVNKVLRLQKNIFRFKKNLALKYFNGLDLELENLEGPKPLCFKYVDYTKPIKKSKKSNKIKYNKWMPNNVTSKKCSKRSFKKTMKNLNIHHIRSIPIDKVWDDIINHKKNNKVFSNERIKLESYCRDVQWQE